MNTAETDLITWIWRDNDVSLIGVFGSSAREEATATSDIETGSAKYWGELVVKHQDGFDPKDARF